MSKDQITTSKGLIHNTLFNVITQIIQAVITFFLIRFFLGKLGEAKYGVWIIVASIFNYRTMLSMGLNSSINRYIPVYLATKDEEGIQRVISTSLFFFSALSIVLILASIVVYYNIGSWFAISPNLVATAGILVLVVGFCFAIAMPLQLSSAVLSGLQRYDLMNLAILIHLLIRTVLLVILLSFDYGVVTIGLMYGLSEISVRVMQLIFIKKLMPHISISLKNIDFTLLRQMLAYGINTLLYAMAGLIMYKSSDILIGIFISTTHVARFSVAAASVMLLSKVEAFTRAIKPAVSDLDARDDRARIHEVAFLSQKYILLLLIPAICFLVVMSREFLSVWIGAKFPDPTIVDELSVILAILAIGHGLRLSQHSNFMVLVGKGEHRVFGILAAISAIFCVTLAILSIKVLNLGLIGIAWSNFLPMAITSGMVLPVYFNWKMHISMRESVQKVWWPALLGSLPSVFMISIWKYLAPPDSWLELFAVVIAATATTLASSWLLSLKAIERKRFIYILARRK
ncbi:MAG: lipopolysaccharide biosynthesis protein [Planctomycetota bacterium]|jgi:O-antigen/teichoic acid export membrane protein